jgi:hypothetical protein
MFLCTHCGDWQCRKWQYLSKVPTFWRCCGVEKNIFLVLSGPWIQLNNKLITEWKFKNRTLSSESKQMSLINAVNTSKVLVGAISLVLIVISTHRLPNGRVFVQCMTDHIPKFMHGICTWKSFYPASWLLSNSFSWNV